MLLCRSERPHPTTRKTFFSWNRSRGAGTPTPGLVVALGNTKVASLAARELLKQSPVAQLGVYNFSVGQERCQTIWCACSSHSPRVHRCKSSRLLSGRRFAPQLPARHIHHAPNLQHRHPNVPVQSIRVQRRNQARAAVPGARSRVAMQPRVLHTLRLLTRATLPHSVCRDGEDERRRRWYRGTKRC